MKRIYLITSIVCLFVVPAFPQSKLVDNEVIKTNDGTKTYLIAKSLTIQPPNSSQSVVFTASSSTSYVFRMVNPDTQGFPSIDQNFVRTETILVPNVTSESSIKNLAVDQKTTVYKYLDGLGRPLQDVTVQGSASLQDLIQPYAYDDQGRQRFEYLPFSKPTARKGQYNPSAVEDQDNFYKYPPATVAKDSRAYKENIFEASPLNRVVETFGPGADWKDKNKSIKSYTKLNDASEGIRRWKYYTSGLPEQDGTYPDNQLLVQETTNEEGQTTRVYKNLRDQVILSRVGSGSEWFDTYYLYSPAGLLTMVIQPEGVHRLDTEFFAAGANKQSFINRWCFQYQYDDEQRQVAKRIPGWEPGYWAYTVYDKWNRVVLTQTPLQKQGNDGSIPSNQWTFYKYDRFNRVIITGVYASTKGRQALQDDVNMHYLNSTDKRFETEVNDATGYTLNKNFPVNPAESSLLTVAYYDNYNFKNYSNWDQEGSANNYNYVNVSGFPVYSTDPNTSKVMHVVKGYETGSKVRVLGTNRWLNSIKYYDKQYRVIQTIAENYVGGYEQMSTDYDFVGKVLKTQVKHTSSTDTYTALRTFDYDHGGRLLNLWQSINGSSPVLLASNKYNELGQLIEKNIHSTDNGASFLQSIDMRYNIRGWLTSINNSTLTNDGSLNNDTNDLFGMELLYNPADPPVVNGLPFADSKARKFYDGNISAIKWKTDTKQGQAEERVYAFDYDVLNRLKKAYYARKNSSGAWAADVGMFNEGISSYDKNGNIQGIERYGKIEGSIAPIDNTTYGYNYIGNYQGALADFAGGSNRLLKVQDTGNSYGFKDASEQLDEEYRYDASGNLISDHNKSISKIRYNHLNLPEMVQFTLPSGVDRIYYTYDATGIKLRTTVYKNGTAGSNGTLVWQTDYAGEVQYDKQQDEGRQFSFASTPEGRVVKNGANYEHEYFYKDHQGNVRLTYGTMKETVSYRATLENPPSPSTLEADENATFKNINSTRYQDSPGVTFNYTKSFDKVLHPDKSSRTNSHPSVNRPIGPAKSLYLAQGDKVKMEVFAKFNQAPGPGQAVDPAILIVNLATNTFGFSQGEIGYTSFQNNAPFIPGIGSGSSTVPKAYLAFLFFNESFGFVTSGAVPVTSSAFNAFEKLERIFTAPQNGHLYVYVANESATPTSNVYFDEMLIVHQKNNSTIQVTQASDYYPFGLMFNTYQAERISESFGSVYKNRYGFQGQELQKDLDLGWSQFKWRMHDPAIGRFGGVDPLSEKYDHNSTYAFSENKPINGIDLEGLEHVYTIHSATVSQSFKNAVVAGDIYRQREIMSWAQNNKFTTPYAVTHTFMDSEKPVNNNIVSYRHDPSFSGVIVNTTSNINNLLVQDKVSFMFPPAKEKLMFDKNYPVDVMTDEYYGGNDFRGILIGETLEGGKGLSKVGGSAVGWGRIKGYGFVQYTADITIENNALLNLGAFNGFFTGKYSGDSSGKHFFGSKFSGPDGKWIGKGWQFNVYKSDYSLKKLEELKQIFDDKSSIWNVNFSRLSGYQQVWQYTKPR